MLAPLITRRAFARMAGTALISRAVASPAAAAARQATSLTGRVIWPDDPAYAEARLAFNARYSRFPAAIVFCQSASDVQHAVRWAREYGVPLRARSGGHSYEGLSVLDDGLVIDVSELSDVTVDLARGEAVVGAGVRLLDLYQRLAAYGVTIPAGTCPTVGIAGLTLGGGIGFLSRQHGLTCDNLLAIDLVDANGDHLRASELDSPDLFWALRGGGGGNFGIVTAFTFRVHQIANVALCSLSWPWADAAAVLDTWQRWAPFTDERLTVSLAIGSAFSPVTAFGLFTGPEAELPGLLAPLLRAGTAAPPAIWSTTWLDAATQLAGAPIPPGTLHFKNASAFVETPLRSRAIATLVEQMSAAPAGSLIGFIPLRGAVAEIAPTATAFPHRQALFDMQYQAYWWDPAAAAAPLAWIRSVREAMLRHTSGAYVNYIDLDLADWATAYYGANLARLANVRAAYDPEYVFNGPQSVPRIP